ncbi:MAG: DUF554 domain-containing protein [Clostridia bacterium]|nr:DUF554 domain-containing protein [Clostridia bacterium]
MPFLGTIVNFLVVLVCGLIGLLIKKGIPKKVCDSLKSAMAICVIYIGIDGALDTAPYIGSELLSDGLIKVLIMVISLALGTLVGELIDIDKWVNRLGDSLEKRFVKEGEQGKFAEGFVYCSMLFCVGAMTVNGAFQDALGHPDILITKAVIDGIMCLVLAPTLGIGCAVSSVFVLVYQGLLTLAGLFLVGILPAESIAYMSSTGSLIIILIGLNMLGEAKVKTANMTPAIFLPALIYPLFELILSAFSG